MGTMGTAGLTGGARNLLVVVLGESVPEKGNWVGCCAKARKGESISNSLPKELLQSNSLTKELKELL